RIAEAALLERHVRCRGRALDLLIDLDDIELPALARIERETDRDRQEPRRDLCRTSRIEGRKCAERANERLLREILDLRALTDQPRAHTKDHALVPDNERAERHRVLLPAAIEDGDVERWDRAPRRSRTATARKGDTHRGCGHHRSLSRQRPQKVPRFAQKR